MSKIYLDPGHGGSDPGAVGHGLQEKDVVLKIAKYTKDFLQDNYKNISVRMSRSTDKFLSLTHRTNDANSWGADVFVSIHINAFNGEAHGYEDFIFNGNVSSKTHDLQDAIHQEVARLFRNNRGQKRANFAVVRQSKMPAVLTENGFIDNEKDADYLSKNGNLKKIAEAHAKGIAVFLGLDKRSSKPKTSSGTYTVKSGDTLWSIAHKNGMSVNKLKKLNGLTSNTIHPGDKLKLSGELQSSKQSKPSGDVATIQDTLNDRYGLSISVDNIPGPETYKALLKGYQTELNKQFGANLTVDGIWGPKTAAASVTVRKGAQGNLTWILQAALRCKGYNIKVDGIFGGKTEDAVKQYQRDKGIGVDGVPGKNTFAKMFG